MGLTQLRGTIRLASAASLRVAAGRLWTFHQGLPASSVVDACSPLDSAATSTIPAYETSIRALVGAGDAVAFASGRMGFYALIRNLGISPGDEVVLPGFTCAVMANAVLRSGATPVYADIASDTLGSDAAAIEAALSPRTRMIVAQHSFGYPCDIEPIVDLARKNGVFLLEDCATTLGSTRNGRAVGTFGDAALFSTDHTKPLVTHTGGFIYSERTDVIEGLRQAQAASGELPDALQAAMWNRMALEARLRSPRGQLQLFARDLALGLIRPMAVAGAFLAEDFGASGSEGTYPYPARLPHFLAEIGLAQVEAWPARARQRHQALNTLVDAVRETSSGEYLPGVLTEPACDIVPLRLAWSQPDGEVVRRKLRTRLATEGTWFRSPVSVASDPLENYGYHRGSCPTSEQCGPGMVNIPIPDAPDEVARLAAYIQRRLAS